jgi:cytochrome c oxidase subunit 1
MVAVQIVFALNFILSMFLGPRAGRNPWHSNGLEWQAPSPPGHGNFDFQPVVYRGPYEYASPEVDADFYPQTEPPPADKKPDVGDAPPAH